ETPPCIAGPPLRTLHIRLYGTGAIRAASVRDQPPAPAEVWTAARRAATRSIYQLPIDGLPDFRAGTSMPTMRTPKEAGGYHVYRTSRSADRGDPGRLR